VYDDGLPFSAWGALGEHNVGFPNMLMVDTGDGFVPKPGNLQYLIDASLRSMLPTIKAGVSLPNILIEMKDLHSLPETLSRIKSFVLGLPSRSLVNTKYLLKGLSRKEKNVRRMFANSYGPTLREATGAGADGYLQTQFNILPLLSDMSRCDKALLDLQRRIRDYVDRQGKKQIRHFRHISSQAQTPTSTQTSSSYVLDSNPQWLGNFTLPGGVYQCEKRNTRAIKLIREYYPDYVSEFHAQVEFNYNLTKFQQEHAQILGFLDALGVNMNPSITWNAIPYSFIVDWFIDVSRWLDNRKHINMEPVTNITRYLWSCKQVRRVRLRVIPGAALPAGSAYQTPDTYLPDLYEETYRRDVGLPKPSEQPYFFEWLSLKQGTLAAALAITRLKRFRPRGW